MNQLHKNLLTFFVTCLLALICCPLVLLSQVVSGSLSDAHGSLGIVDQERILVHIDKPYYLTGETLWFTAYCTNLRKGTPSKISSVVYLELFDDADQPVAQLFTGLKNGVASGQLLLGSNLTTGAYLLRAYTSWMKNGRPENFYQQKITIINPLTALDGSQVMEPSNEEIISSFNQPQGSESNYLAITTDKPTYYYREPVNIEITPLGADSLQNYQLSISVYPYHKSLENQPIDAGNRVLPPQDDHVIQNISYFPETIGPIIYGNYSGPPTEHLMVSIAGNNARVYQALWTDSSEFVLQLTQETNYNGLYFWTPGQQKPKASIRSVFDQRPPAMSLERPRFDSATIHFIEDQSVNMQVVNLYLEYTNVHGMRNPPDNTRTPFYGDAEYRYQLDDYTRFPSLEEVFREYVRYVSLRRKGGVLNMFVWDQYANEQSLANNVFFDLPALVLLDGIPVLDAEWLLEQDPLRIKAIEIITKKYMVGDQTFHGIVNLLSYDEDFVKSDLGLELQMLDFPELQQAYNFSHPEYPADSIQSRIPDRRNTLYWKPRIRAGSTNPFKLKFYAGDVSGYYQVVVRGISSNGQTVHLTSQFQVIRRDVQ
jgi:hypothetical protein